MPAITLSLKEHKGQERIFAAFPYSKKINDLIRQTHGIKWSQSKKQWHLPADKKSVAALQQKINSLATIDTSLLKQQLEERKKKPALAVVAKNNVVLKRLAQISNANDHILPLMQQQLKLKAYSASTIKTYINEMAQLLQMLGNIPADELKPAHLKRYLVYCYEKLQSKRKYTAQPH